MNLFNSSNNLETLHYGRAFRHAAATPLSSLLINLELAQKHQSIARVPYVQQALHSAYRLKELFWLSKISGNKSFPVEIFFQEALKLIKYNSPHVVINSHLDFPKNTRLKGNRFYFQEAIICSLENAIESYIGLKPGLNRIIVITGHIKNSQLLLSFTDGGRGMNWLERSLIFADGYTNKKQGSGTGLTWVKRVIEQHFSGQIKVKSQKNRGTTMTWILPLDQERQ
jgi:signal transduction histidine kinase